jgi:hypothetical protein
VGAGDCRDFFLEEKEESSIRRPALVNKKFEG